MIYAIDYRLGGQKSHSSWLIERYVPLPSASLREGLADEAIRAQLVQVGGCQTVDKGPNRLSQVKLYSQAGLSPYN